MAFAITYNLPRFFEFCLEANEDGSYRIATTSLRQTPSYFIYYNLWSKFIFVEVILRPMNCPQGPLVK